MVPKVNTPQRSQAQRHMGNRFSGEASKGFRELCHVALRFECHPFDWERKQKNNKTQPRNQGKLFFVFFVVVVVVVVVVLKCEFLQDGRTFCTTKTLCDMPSTGWYRKN